MSMSMIMTRIKKQKIKQKQKSNAVMKTHGPPDALLQTGDRDGGQALVADRLAACMQWRIQCKQ